VTLWGAILLVAFLVIGLSSRLASRDAMRAAVVVIAVVILAMRAVAW
jgi:hypothetical protein